MLVKFGFFMFFIICSFMLATSLARYQFELNSDTGGRVFLNGTEISPSYDSSVLPGVLFHIYMGVSENRGTPKWMVDNGKPY